MSEGRFVIGVAIATAGMALIAVGLGHLHGWEYGCCAFGAALVAAGSFGSFVVTVLGDKP